MTKKLLLTGILTVLGFTAMAPQRCFAWPPGFKFNVPTNPQKPWQVGGEHAFVGVSAEERRFVDKVARATQMDALVRPAGVATDIVPPGRGSVFSYYATILNDDSRRFHPTCFTTSVPSANNNLWGLWRNGQPPPPGSGVLQLR